VAHTLILPGNAVPANVLIGTSFSAGVNYGAQGSMPNNGALTLTPGASAQLIPAGYHNGSGTVPAVAVPAANVLTGTTIAGTAGTMPNKGAMTLTPGASVVAIPAGYHNGSGTVPAVVVPAAKVLTGTTIAGTAGSVPVVAGGNTLTPNTVTQTAIAAGNYATSAINVAGSANLIATNILNGINLFGIVGNLNPSKSATGTFTTGGTNTGFISNTGAQAFEKPVTVTNLTFTPKIVLINNGGFFTIYCNGANFGDATNWADIVVNNSSTSTLIRMVSPASMSSNGFVLPFFTANALVTYWAFG
jgi:hypothetical protein